MKRIFKENYKFIFALILVIFVFTIKFPYYIDAPGGIDDVSKKIEIDGYSSVGTFNLAFVKEYRATIPTLFISMFNKDWKIIKSKEVLLDTEDDKSYLTRDRILLKESISNAIGVAYKWANKDIEVISNRLIVTYISSKSNTDLKVGDEIISIDSIDVYSKKDIENVINSKNVGDLLTINVLSDGNTYNRYASVIDEEGLKKVGLIISNIKDYKTSPSVNVKVDKNESGSSGGLITALSIYNSLVKDDITHGLTIVGTGTIDDLGNIGSIGGVEYKLKSAVKANADLFIVPLGDNYEDAIKLKDKNNYSIKIIGVSTFDEVLSYLEKLAN